jgi:Na+/H+ antiporter NhaD/arsenite permease-like protein
LAALLLCCAASLAQAADAVPNYHVTTLAGIPIEFMFFGIVLLGVATLHRHTLQVAVAGLVVVAAYKSMFTGFKAGSLPLHFAHEWVTLANLLGLLLGFALLSRHFEDSRLPLLLPKFLPDDWKGGFVLLILVFVLSAFLDNIAAALIGGAVAHVVFRGKVHIGYLAGIVAASNGGGSGSVVGDTTTTMMWIAGVNPLEVLDAYSAAVVALMFFGVLAARQQHAYNPITKDAPVGLHVDWARVGIVVFILVMAVAANVVANLHFRALLDHFPVIGVAVWVAILVSVPVRAPEWSILPGALKGSIFLLSLVSIASMMPVEHLPAASWQTALGLGFLSSVFDNIPLTALALKQGGYDWGLLAYSVGFGGSMIWFGSSAGVGLASMYPEARSVLAWVRGGWHVAVAYVIGFFVALAIHGWQPHPLRGAPPVAAPVAAPA